MVNTLADLASIAPDTLRFGKGTGCALFNGLALVTIIKGCFKGTGCALFNDQASGYDRAWAVARDVGRGLTLPGVGIAAKVAFRAAKGIGKAVSKARVANASPRLLSAPKPRGRPNTAPRNGTIYVDSKGNAMVSPPGGRITGSPDGRYIQVRDAAGRQTGTRIDAGHNPRKHPDPRARQPHGHVPGVTNPDGTPWLPIKK